MKTDHNKTHSNKEYENKMFEITEYISYGNYDKIKQLFFSDKDQPFNKNKKEKHFYNNDTELNLQQCIISAIKDYKKNTQDRNEIKTLQKLGDNLVAKKTMINKTIEQVLEDLQENNYDKVREAFFNNEREYFYKDGTKMDLDLQKYITYALSFFIEHNTSKSKHTQLDKLVSDLYDQEKDRGNNDLDFSSSASSSQSNLSREQTSISMDRSSASSFLSDNTYGDDTTLHNSSLASGSNVDDSQKSNFFTSGAPFSKLSDSRLTSVSPMHSNYKDIYSPDGSNSNFFTSDNLFSVDANNDTKKPQRLLPPLSSTPSSLPPLSLIPSLLPPLKFDPKQSSQSPTVSKFPKKPVSVVVVKPRKNSFLGCLPGRKNKKENKTEQRKH